MVHDDDLIQDSQRFPMPEEFGTDTDDAQISWDDDPDEQSEELSPLVIVFAVTLSIFAVACLWGWAGYFAYLWGLVGGCCAGMRGKRRTK